MTTGPAEGPELAGQVRSLEFHGHEWLAYAEAGIALVDAHEVAPERIAVQAEPQQPGLGDRVRAMLGRSVADPDPGPEHTGHHRRTDLIFRIMGGPRPARGDQVRLAVDLDRLLVFDPGGRRVDPVRR
jgi:multiple sugar transport system ATP-binding protein